MKKILFMCVANSARSQLAHGLAKELLRGWAEVESAGSQPSTVNPFAIAVMKEIGIDIASHCSKSVEDLSPDFVQTIDVVVTLCAEEVCPVVLSNAQRIHWPLPDPATKEDLSEGEMLERFRSTRDLLRNKIAALKSEVA